MDRNEYLAAIEQSEWVVVHTPTGDASEPAPLAAALATRRKLGTRYAPIRGYYVAAGRSPRYGEESTEIVRSIADHIGGAQRIPAYDELAS